MGAVLWILQHRRGVDYPMAYMDDGYGIDLSGRLVAHYVDGELRFLPAQQVATLAVWDEIGLPYRAKKVVSGRVVTIIGISIDLDLLTVSLSAASIADFSSRVAHFLNPSQPHGRSPPLRAWRKIIGHASWALTVLPFSRPHLTPLYKKLSIGGEKKERANAGVFTNKKVIEGLRAIVRGLEEDEPLSLLDQGLTEWTEEDADVVVFTDACLSAEGRETLGLGFWFRWNGRLFCLLL
ncbi:hypothetical protein BCR35DRAFT_264161 [Leucosporidium creatinivorum]|uniref:Uncharacterized protein n=1 Tax=Leucosporidium creatinivorum TaxID=106004 RepID=A0A1Y2FTW1_9BASI|nr:hypothetical protein BCR35DRAFT_264161 [Leucosporidium creatinivorum]